jgi:anti-sigma-K factor RskA
MFMKDPDPLDALLRKEWKSPEPSAELDRRVTAAYRFAVRRSMWRGFWTLRVSIPAPALVIAAAAIIALLFWLRPAATPLPAEPSGVVTQLNASGFQPLPNGEARVVPAVEIVK